MNIPEGIIVDIAERVEAMDRPDEGHTAIYKEYIPSPAVLRDENDCRRTLVIMIYFKIWKHSLKGAHQFKAAVQYVINQNWLSEVLHAGNISAGSRVNGLVLKMTQ